jgi:hypothetical protein
VIQQSVFFEIFVERRHTAIERSGIVATVDWNGAIHPPAKDGLETKREYCFQSSHAIRPLNFGRYIAVSRQFPHIRPTSFSPY